MKNPDIFIFMGQSNMAGRGITCPAFPEEAPMVTKEAGLEYRSISQPDRLVPICEPFGKDENRPGGIDDGTMKTGSMVSAFVNAYYQKSKKSMIAISASKGGSSIAQWHQTYLKDALQRLSDCKAYLQKEKITYSHIYMVWCQGETDGDLHTPKEEYLNALRKLFDEMHLAGVETIFYIPIGKCNHVTDQNRYDEMISWQDMFAKEQEDVYPVADCLRSMRARGLMKDEFHYYQQAYNEVGRIAGENVADYLKI